MTDERQPDDPQPTASEAQPTASEPPAMGSEPGRAEAPPPLAPLVERAQASSSEPLEDTTAQPTGSWAPPPANDAPATPATSSYTPPAIPPPAAQPAVSWAPAPPPAGAVTGRRTGLAAGAGILLIVLGIVGGLAGLGVAVIGRAIVASIRDFGPIPELEGMDTETFLSGFVVFFGIIILVYSLLYLFAGIGVLRSRDWGRVIGIIVGILSGLLWLGGLGGTRRAGVDDLGFVVIALAIHVYIVVALLFFWRTKAASG